MESLMKEVNVPELRQNLSGYLGKVRRGERIRVTSRGTVAAELGPPTSSPDLVAAARPRLRGSVLSLSASARAVVDASEWDMNR
jgi:antitoxin (DNA-binding transcriptional repressor) of toxin-antitoxin stability system